MNISIQRTQRRLLFAAFSAVALLAGACSSEPLDASKFECSSADGVPCDDGNICTEKAGTCQTGKCVATAIDCDDGDPATIDSCNATDGCVHNSSGDVVGDGAASDSTESDAESDVESDADDGEGKFTCSSAAECSDGNPCTDDVCANGVACENPANALACDDGDACTIDDKCTAGACVSGGAKSCDDGSACTDDTCDKTDGCKNANNLGACDDGDKCTDKDSCKNGKCEGGGAVDCDDKNGCTTDSCDKASGCKNEATTAGCDDGDKCTLKDACKDKKCVPGAAMDCDDADVCTTGDACKDGACVVGPAKVCDDSNPCTDDSCDSKTGCVSLPNKVTCTAADKCAAVSVCKDKACVIVATLGCNDSNACTDDSCDPAKGCQNLANKAPCTDGDSCTVGDGCANGKCAAGTPTKCDDGKACTIDTCDKDGKCLHSAVQCNDGKTCTTDKCDDNTGKCGFTPKAKDTGCSTTCSNLGKCDGAGVCVGANPDPDGGNCTLGGDGVACKVGYCSKGVCSVLGDRADGAPCSDGNGCTIGDRCETGACVSGHLNSAACDDDDACTLDVCSPVVGSATVTECKHSPQTDGIACNDNDKCTAADSCKAGKCVGIAKCKGSVLIDEAFACGSNGKNNSWTLTGTSNTVKWAVDGTPQSPGFHSPKCSLNYNDGKSYPGKTAGSALSPKMQLPQGKVTLTYWDYADVEKINTYDKRYAEVLVGGKIVSSVQLNNAVGNKKWVKAQIDLTKWAGSEVQVRFRFDSVDTFSNATAGWFIDDVRADTLLLPKEATCATAKECPSDGDPCTADECKGGLCVTSPIKDCKQTVLGLPFRATFDCDSTDHLLWSVGDQPQVGSPTWEIDASPAPPAFHSKGCSLNFNNGETIACAKGQPFNGEIGVFGNAFTPALDARKVGEKAQLRMTMMLAGAWGQTKGAALQVYVTTDDGEHFTFVGNLSSPNSAWWRPVSMDLPSSVIGRVFRVVFRLVTAGCETHSQSFGAFIDDLVIEVESCKAAADCNDENLCTTDTCDIATGRCVHAAVKDPVLCDDGNPCTLTDACALGGCNGHLKPCDDGNACTTDHCDPATGACGTSPAHTGLSCNDANSCTTLDNCDGKGGCAGTPVPFKKACTDGDVCTNVAECKAGKCDTSGEAKAKGASCSDGDGCTAADACDGAGKCVGGDTLVCDDKNSCTTDVCKPGVGCQFTHAANTSKCDDGNACTEKDSCHLGVCSGTDLADGTGCSDGETCTEKDACDRGACIGNAVGNGVKCDDGKKCTVADLCASGKCKGSTQKCNDGKTCTTDSCDEKAGGCVFKNKSSGSYCSDGNACSESDKCDGSGKCVATPSDDGKTCSDSGVCYSTRKCISGVCTGSGTKRPDGYYCTDGDSCTTGDTCTNGQCASKPNLCDDSNACTTDSCLKGAGCVNKPLTDGGTCADGESCTKDDKCYGGKCIGEHLADGASCDDGDTCSVKDICTKGVCDGTAKAKGTSCNDGDPCTLSDFCNGGSCGGVTDLCDDLDSCTTDACVKGVGCKHTPRTNGLSCTDSNACTSSDSCKNGKCTGTALKDGSSCFDLLCKVNEKCAAGKCAGGTNRPDGYSCNDGNPCTSSDKCKGGLCSVGTQKSCDDKSACTLDVCVKRSKFSTGCAHKLAPDNTKCDDGDACTESGCTAGSCIPTKQLCTDEFTDSFACADGVKSWTLSKPAKDGAAAWGVDGTPKAPGYRSPLCSLNFNNGKDFDNGAVKGTATRKLTMPTKTGVPAIRFYQYHSVENSNNYDVRSVTVTMKDGANTKTVHTTKFSNTDRPKTWFRHTASLPGTKGKEVTVEFAFDSKDHINNTGAGWFIDDFQIVMQPEK